MADINGNEKAARLHTMLQETLEPITMKLEKIEQEMIEIRKNQEELKVLLKENRKGF
ncbi:hypothetical protein LG329_18275 [Virgibacillus necropolis]|uniref:hypothetical protein n=1 Tax=Virgibacillus necropolis TaxID=163877 RepID=UPI00384C82B3